MHISFTLHRRVLECVCVCVCVWGGGGGGGWGGRGVSEWAREERWGATHIVINNLGFTTSVAGPKKEIPTTSQNLKDGVEEKSND